MAPSSNMAVSMPFSKKVNAAITLIQAEVFRKPFILVYLMINIRLQGTIRLNNEMGTALVKNHPPSGYKSHTKSNIISSIVSTIKQVSALLLDINAISPIHANTKGRNTTVIPNRTDVKASKNQSP